MKSIASIIEGAISYSFNRRAVKGLHRRTTEGALNQGLIGWVLADGGLHLHEPLVITPEQRARHLYVLGATGSGKTNLILQLLAQDLAEHRSVAVIDLRGDLVDRVLARLAAADPQVSSDRVRLLDLRDSERIIGFNPLSGGGDPHSRAYLVLDALKAHAGSWGVQLEETLRNALVALTEANLNLLDLEPLLTDAAFRNGVLLKTSDPSVLAFFDRYGALSKERQQAWFLPVLNKVTPLLGVPRLRLLFGASPSLDLKQAINTEGTILLVALAVDRLHSAARLVGSLIVGGLETAVMSRVDLPERARIPVNLYVDEFESMATEAFSSIVAEGRRFGLSLTLSHQNLSQIPTNLRQVIRNNVQTQIFFQTGSIDARELRHELSLGEDEDVVKELQSLPVGHAYLQKRPDEAVLVRFERTREPTVSKRAIKELTDRVHDAMGSQTVNEVQDAITTKRASLVEDRQQAGGHEQGSPIRHERLPRRSRKGSK